VFGALAIRRGGVLDLLRGAPELAQGDRGHVPALSGPRCRSTRSAA
jgi:hypothetical protein